MRRFHSRIAVPLSTVALLAACSFGGGGTTGGDGTPPTNDTASGADVVVGTDVQGDDPSTTVHDSLTPNDPGTDLSAPCESGMQSCDGDYMLMCIDSAWQRMEPACAQGCTEGHCNTCRPGTRTCNGNTILLCSANGAGTELFQTCTDGPCVPDPAHCQGCLADEACNGIDDDCDGSTDEGIPELMCGLGACKRWVNACIDGIPQTCQPAAPGIEDCNGVDDDCDGQTDEDLTQACSNSCGSGTRSCQLGSWTVCNAPTPSTEVCDGMDNDCDGQTDEGLQCGTETGTCKDIFACLQGCGSSGTTCQQECQTEASSTAQSQFVALANCMENNGCNSATTDAEFQQCLGDYCIDPYFQCFAGTQYTTCGALVNCLNGCGTNSTCGANCYDGATYQANKDLHTLQVCWSDACTMCSDSGQETACNTCINESVETGGACATAGAKCF